jgi:LysM repeat protein
MSNHYDDDAFWDDPGFDPDRTSQLQRVRRHGGERTRSHHVVRREQPLEPLDEDATIWVEPAPSVAQRLGPLGAIDPRVLSIGAVVLAAVLAVPLFGALGNDGNGDDQRAIEQQSTTTVADIVTPTTAPAPADAVVVTTAAVDPAAAGELEGDDPAEFADTEDASTGDESAGDESADATEPAPALADDPDCANQYTAAAGDYWVRIADSAGLDLDSLLDVNSATADTPIFPGSTICLPGDAAAAAPAAFAANAGSAEAVAAAMSQCTNVYESAAGDYWLRLAEATGVELDELLDLNNATAETPLYPGTEVCLPSGASVAGGAGGASAAAERCTNRYESAAGDYWLRIAHAAELELDELLDLNDATAETPLYPGSEVCLPPGAKGPANTTTPPTTAPPSTAAPTTPAPASTEPPTTPAPATTDPPTTTEPPTTEPHPPPPPAGEIEQIIRDVWPDELEDQALRIAWRESSYNPYAQNFCCSGLFQIYYEVHAGWLADLGVDERSDLYDPRTNATAAYALYQRSGSWEPWRMTAD